jgi:hypothetical protein
MQALAYWKAVTSDRSGFLEQLVETLKESGLRFCVIGGQGVNAYVEPVVSLDLDIAVAGADLPALETLLRRHFDVVEFPHGLSVSQQGSELRAQLQRDPRYSDFAGRATVRTVLGLSLPVATVEDVLQGKLWAVQDPGRRPSKRQKDLADIARLLEAYPALRERVPQEVLARLI